MTFTTAINFIFTFTIALFTIFYCHQGLTPLHI